MKKLQVKSGKLKVQIIKTLLCTFLFALSTLGATPSFVGFTNLTTSSAGLIYAVDSAATGTLYYGQTSGGTNATNWSASVALGALESGTNTFTLTNLTPARIYYARLAATDTNTTWSAPTNFWTLAGNPASVSGASKHTLTLNASNVIDNLAAILLSNPSLGGGFGSARMVFTNGGWAISPGLSESNSINSLWDSFIAEKNSLRHADSNLLMLVGGLPTGLVFSSSIDGFFVDGQVSNQTLHLSFSGTAPTNPIVVPPPPPVPLTNNYVFDFSANTGMLELQHPFTTITPWLTFEFWIKLSAGFSTQCVAQGNSYVVGLQDFDAQGQVDQVIGAPVAITINDFLPGQGNLKIHSTYYFNGGQDVYWPEATIARYLSPGEWHHVAIQTNGIWVDGTNSYTGFIPALGGTNFVIGNSWHTNAPFTGALSGIRASTILRYSGTFAPTNAYPENDFLTAALWLNGTSTDSSFALNDGSLFRNTLLVSTNVVAPVGGAGGAGVVEYVYTTNIHNALKLSGEETLLLQNPAALASATVKTIEFWFRSTNDVPNTLFSAPLEYTAGSPVSNKNFVLTANATVDGIEKNLATSLWRYDLADPEIDELFLLATTPTWNKNWEYYFTSFSATLPATGLVLPKNLPDPDQWHHVAIVQLGLDDLYNSYARTNWNRVRKGYQLSTNYPVNFAMIDNAEYVAPTYASDSGLVTGSSGPTPFLRTSSHTNLSLGYHYSWSVYDYIPSDETNRYAAYAFYQPYQVAIPFPTNIFFFCSTNTTWENLGGMARWQWMMNYRFTNAATPGFLLRDDSGLTTKSVGYQIYLDGQRVVNCTPSTAEHVEYNPILGRRSNREDNPAQWNYYFQDIATIQKTFERMSYLATHYPALITSNGFALGKRMGSSVGGLAGSIRGVRLSSAPLYTGNFAPPTAYNLTNASTLAVWLYTNAPSGGTNVIFDETANGCNLLLTNGAVQWSADTLITTNVVIP